MVAAKTVAKVIIAASLLILSALTTFIAQLYAPTILWILSVLAIIFVVISPLFIYRRSARIVAIFLCSLIICASYLFYSITGGSPTDFVIYGLGLWAITWSILFFLSETVASLTPGRSH